MQDRLDEAECHEEQRHFGESSPGKWELNLRFLDLCTRPLSSIRVKTRTAVSLLVAMGIKLGVGKVLHEYDPWEGII